MSSELPVHGQQTLSGKEEPVMTVGINGSKDWRLKNGKLHREDGPAYEGSDGSREWYIGGKRHREDGPAYEGALGNKSWYINGERHREKGPAAEWANGDRWWYKNGKLHREDGPAIEDPDGCKSWYINGEKLSEDMWKARVNIKKKVSPEHQQSVIDILNL